MLVNVCGELGEGEGGGDDAGGGDVGGDVVKVFGERGGGEGGEGEGGGDAGGDAGGAACELERPLTPVRVEPGASESSRARYTQPSMLVSTNGKLAADFLTGFF